MTKGKGYEITKKIKLHTKPLREEEIIKEGIFMKETAKTYIFDDFKVSKSTVIKIEEMECDMKWLTMHIQF